MKSVGLTGGIGAGKSVVARILQAMGYPVYFSDHRARELTQNHPDIRKGLTNILGEDIYHDGKLDRPKLAELLFKDDALREQVNNIIHPIVRKDFSDWLALQVGKLAFNEAAILFETGYYKRFDVTILVTAPLDLRIERVMKRDGISKEAVLSRINKQWSEDRKISLTDHVILNDEKKPLLAQLEKIVTLIQ